MRTYSDTINPHVGFSPHNKPSLIMKHIDGPLLHFSDGQMHWLTLWEHLLVKLGYHNAQTLQTKLRPHLTWYLTHKEYVSGRRRTASHDHEQ
jgi:hypothetical protein